MRTLLFAFIVLCGAASAQLSEPQISSQQTVYDFGRMFQGDTVKYSFIVSNTGGDLLKIEKVISTCGCTVAERSKDELKPGESATITVAFDTRDRIGPQTKLVAIQTNDPNTRYFRLTLRGEIVEKPIDVENAPAIAFESNAHDFGTVTEGDVLECEFTIRNDGASPLIIKDVMTSCGCTVAAPEKTALDPGERAGLLVEFDTKNRHGRTTRTITVVSNDPRKPYAILTVYAVIQNKG
ncbi:MAG: DUF1573 domain-containing protein [Ignavibacteriales bacterium]|nr:DUF1573 domain-containing protein [Ignavibacteriales bacterium]